MSTCMRGYLPVVVYEYMSTDLQSTWIHEYLDRFLLDIVVTVCAVIVMFMLQEPREEPRGYCQSGGSTTCPMGSMYLVLG